MTDPIKRLPTLRQLAYLQALQEHQHFGRAAAACAVTQSTLSSGLAELEQTLGAKLVERTRRSLQFTELGEEVARRAREVMRAATDLAEAVQTVREPLSSPLRMAVIPTVAPFVLPRLLAATAARWPRLKLSVREMMTAAACEALGRSAVDCVLLALPAACGEVAVSELFHDDLLLVSRPEGRRADGAALRAADLVLLDEGHCLREHALAACGLAKGTPDAQLTATTLQTLVRLVDAGLGVTLLPRMAVEAGVLEGTGLAAWPNPPRTHRRIALAWRRLNPRTADLQLFAATLREALAPGAPQPAAARVTRTGAASGAPVPPRQGA